MSEVIQPGTGQTIITTDDHHHRNHGDGCGHRHDELRTDADYRSLIAQGSVNGDRINSGVQVTGDRVNAVGAAGALASCRTNELVQGTACKTDQLVLDGHARDREVVQAGFGGVHDRLCDAKAGIVSAVERGFAAEALADCKLGDQVGEAKLATAVGFKDAIIASNVGFSAATVQASAIGAAAQLEAAKNAAALSVEATRNANLVSVEAAKNFYALSVEAVKNAAAAQLEAQKNASAQALEMCKCCGEIQSQADRNFAALQAQADRNTCDIKQLVTAEGVAGRALQNEIEARRVQNELQRLQTQVLVLTGGAIGGAGARAV